MTKLLSGFLSLACALWIFGCAESGPTRYPLSGAVTLDGQPVAAGFVTFEPVQATGKAAPTASTSVENGQYQLHQDNGPGKGGYLVRLSPPLVESGTANPPKTFPVQTMNVDVPDGGGKLELKFVQIPVSGGK